MCIRDRFNFRGRPEYVQILSGSSVEGCTLANTHALDFKEAGLNDTAANVMNAGMGAAGYQNAWYEEKDGVRVCFLAFTEWDYSADEIAARVRGEAAGSDIVIVSMHWGEEDVYKRQRQHDAHLPAAALAQQLSRLRPFRADSPGGDVYKRQRYRCKAPRGPASGRWWGRRR